MFYKEYINYIESDDWETVHNSFSVKAPENFNFAYDIIDRMAKEYPEKEGLVWCDETEERIFSFGELAKRINKTANFFKAMGIGRGDTVLLFCEEDTSFGLFFLPCTK